MTHTTLTLAVHCKRPLTCQLQQRQQQCCHTLHIAKLRVLKVQFVSTGPQTLPATIPAAAGIKAFYFRDPDGHNLEVIYVPQGKGDPRWQTKTEALFLGIDHTAIGISNTDKVWPKGRPVPKIGGHATMRVGEPFRLSDELPEGLDRKAQKALSTDLIMHRIAALLDERHRGPYAQAAE